MDGEECSEGSTGIGEAVVKEFGSGVTVEPDRFYANFISFNEPKSNMFKHHPRRAAAS